MNWLLRKLAQEETYFPIFLGVLTLYAVLGCVVFGLVANYLPKAAGVTATMFMIGAGLVAVGMRMTHNLAYAKVNGVHNDDKDSV